MGSSTRHSAPGSPLNAEAYRRAISPSSIPEQYYAIRVRPPLAHRVVHSEVREWLEIDSAEWVEPRAVADQRDSSPVGKPLEADSLLEVQRQGRVSNQRRGQGLVGVDDALPLRSVSVTDG